MKFYVKKAPFEQACKDSAVVPSATNRVYYDVLPDSFGPESVTSQQKPGPGVVHVQSSEHDHPVFRWIYMPWYELKEVTQLGPLVGQAAALLSAITAARRQQT